MIFLKIQTVFFLLLSGIIFAQEKTPKPLHIFEGNGGGIVMFDNNRFLLFGYATLVFGDYTGNNEKFHFKPDKFSAFLGYGRKDPLLKDKIRIRFNNFERDYNYLQLGKGDVVPVLNEDNNCVSNYLIKEFPVVKNDTQFTLINGQRYEQYADGKNANTFFLNGNNDFVISHKNLRRYDRDFEAVIAKQDNKILLHTDQYGIFEDTREWIKGEEPRHDDIKSLIGWDQKIDFENLFLNEDERIVSPTDAESSTFDVNKYVQDDKNNVLVFKGNVEELPDKYDREVRVYKKLVPEASSKIIPKGSEKLKSLFFSTCESSESYHYQTKSERENEKQQEESLREKKPVLVPMIISND